MPPRCQVPHKHNVQMMMIMMSSDENAYFSNNDACLPDANDCSDVNF